MNKKMRKKMLLVLIGTLTVLTVGCGLKEEAKGSTSSSRFKLEFVSSYYEVDEYRDTETGVHYLIYCNPMGYAGAGGICPRYNADGTLYVD